MYRGKFDAKHKGSGMTEMPKRTSQQEVPPARNAAPQTGRQMPPARGAAPQQPSRQMPAGRPMPAGKQNTQQRQGAQQPRQNMQQQNVRQNYQPVQQQTVQEVRRGPRVGTVIFYTFYFLFIFLFFIGTFLGLKYLRSFLVDFEAAQPTVQSQQVFDSLFADPDWSKLYDMAKVEDTPYEGKEEFVAYMENLVGDKDLNMIETSAGLSGGKKYYVRVDDVRVASFTMTSDTDLTDMTQIPDWKLGEVGVFFERNESYRIQKQDGHTATVNGVALDDSFTIQITTTAAEEYLPIQVNANRTCVQEITGLMALPEVKITDSTGKEMEVVYDEASRTFVEQTEANAITDELKNVAKKYAQPRKTGIIWADEVQEQEEFEQVEDYPVTLFLSREGYFKKITPQSLRMSSEQKYKEDDGLRLSFEAGNRSELLIFTDRQQVYKARVADFEDSKASVLGVYLPTKLGMDEGENVLTMIDPGDYSGQILLFFENGKCARLELSAYATKTNRKRLTGAYSDKSPLRSVLLLREDCEVACYTTEGRALVFNTALL